jgi:hypothetical protein
MKKTFFLFLCFGLSQIVSAQAVSSSAKGPEGMWKCSAPEAPYQYQSFNMLIERTNDKYTGKIIGEGGFEMPLENVVYKDSAIEASVYVDNASIPLKFKWDGIKLKGAAVSDQGDISITAERIEVTVKKPGATDTIPATKTDTVPSVKK